jgi:hypothetical protein
MTTVTLKGVEVELKPPASLAAAYDVAAAAGKNSMRGLAAALGLCWDGKQRLRSDFTSTYNALEFGGQVFDELLAWGAKPEEIQAAGAAALVLACDSLPSADEVDAAEGNSEDQEDATSS